MEEMVAWAGPLLLIPGVALLIISTSARFGQLHAELHRQLAAGNDGSVMHLRRRAGLLHTALVSLYASVGILAFASLFGAVFRRWFPSLTYIPETIMFLGVCTITFAAIQLIRESRLLITVIDDDIDYHSKHRNSS